MKKVLIGLNLASSILLANYAYADTNTNYGKLIDPVQTGEKWTNVVQAINVGTSTPSNAPITLGNEIALSGTLSYTIEEDGDYPKYYFTVVIEQNGECSKGEHYLGKSTVQNPINGPRYYEVSIVPSSEDLTKCIVNIARPVEQEPDAMPMPKFQFTHNHLLSIPDGIKGAAVDIEYFTMLEDSEFQTYGHYLAVPIYLKNIEDKKVYDGEVLLFRWDSESDSFEPFDNNGDAIDASGATDVKHFNDGENNYLVVANSMSDPGVGIVATQLWIFEKEINAFVHVEDMKINNVNIHDESLSETYSSAINPQDMVIYEVGGKIYLAIAYGGNEDVGYSLKSPVLVWNGTSFNEEPYSTFITHNGYGLELLEHEGQQYLSVANRNNLKTTHVESAIYPIQADGKLGTANVFKTKGARQIIDFEIDDIHYFLASNSYSDTDNDLLEFDGPLTLSDIYQWYGATMVKNIVFEAQGPKSWVHIPIKGYDFFISADSDYYHYEADGIIHYPTCWYWDKTVTENNFKDWTTLGDPNDPRATPYCIDNAPETQMIRTEKMEYLEIDNKGLLLRVDINPDTSTVVQVLELEIE